MIIYYVFGPSTWDDGCGHGGHYPTKALALEAAKSKADTVTKLWLAPVSRQMLCNLGNHEGFVIGSEVIKGGDPEF